MEGNRCTDPTWKALVGGATTRAWRDIEQLKGDRLRSTPTRRPTPARIGSARIRPGARGSLRGSTPTRGARSTASASVRLQLAALGRPRRSSRARGPRSTVGLRASCPSRSLQTTRRNLSTRMQLRAQARGDGPRGARDQSGTVITPTGLAISPGSSFARVARQYFGASSRLRVLGQ